MHREEEPRSRRLAIRRFIADLGLKPGIEFVLYLNCASRLENVSCSLGCGAALAERHQWLLLHRLPYPLRDHGRMIIERARPVRSNPFGPVMSTLNPPRNGSAVIHASWGPGVLPARDDRRLNALAPGAGNALDVEDGQRHETSIVTTKCITATLTNGIEARVPASRKLRMREDQH
jgi:hypothetical protein